MPVHDWNRVDAGTYHAFHCVWIAELQKSLNRGVLPQGYYALAEQGAEVGVADILALQTSGAADDPPRSGGIALAEAPPLVSRRLRPSPNATYRAMRRTLAVRHVTGHRVVALIEIASPANKDRAESVEDFVDKAEAALKRGLHVLIADLLPPNRHAPSGLGGSVLDRVELLVDEEGNAGTLADGRQPALVALRADRTPEAFVEYPGIGDRLPDMPLFLDISNYVNVPLETTYTEAYLSMPEFWRDVLEGRS